MRDTCDQPEGVTPIRRNGPRRTSVLLGEALTDMNDLGPVKPGCCDFCGARIPKERRRNGSARYCSDQCKKWMDAELRNLGRQLAQISLHWIEGRKKKGAALARMDKVMRHFRRRLHETREHYKWGKE